MKVSTKVLTMSIEDLRSALPIPFVLSQYGFEPAAESDGKLHYRNPWRDDANPSLDVFRDPKGNERAGDYAEGFNGSVLDVIGRQIGYPNDIGKILAEARVLYQVFVDEGWEGPTIGDAKPKVMDEDVVARVAAAPQVSLKHDVVVELLQKNQGIEPSTLRAFGVKHHTSQVIAIPYPDGKAIKFRHYGGAKSYLAGSAAGLYYHPNEDLDTATNILLVEGESDHWAAWPLWNGMVVSVPGVGHQPSKYMSLFEGKQVTLAFDGDVAGRDATLRWHAALTAVGCSPRIIPVPTGEDLASQTRSELSRLLGLGRPLVRNNTGMSAAPDGYVIEDKKGETHYVSNWTVRPVRVFDFGDEAPRAFEVEVLIGGEPSGQPVVLTSEDLSQRKLHTWASQFSGAWWGGPVDHQKLRAVIEEGAAFVPVVSATTKPGLLAGSFVVPGLTIGDAAVVCVEDSRYPMSSPDVFRLTPGEVDPAATVARLMAMQTQQVMQPILAWLAAAPLRSLFPQFPPLFVTGRAGSGKTTVVHEALSIFSGVLPVTNLTSTTPYALALTMGGTNAFPVWFDEYRPGAARTTMDMMAQILRDAYDGAPSRRGGLTDDKTRVTTISTTNPLLVSGEDFADEQSHRDRLIKVMVPSDTKGRLPIWQEEDYSFAYDYLSWLTERENGVGDSPAERVYLIDKERYLAAGVTERQAYNLAVLDVGWRLLRDYLFDRSGHVLGPPDWRALLEVSQDEAAGDPILDSLRLLYERDGDTRGMWYSEADNAYYVSAGLVLGELERSGAKLPFTSPRAMTMYLVNDMKGEQVKRLGPLTAGKQIRYVKLANPWAGK